MQDTPPPTATTLPVCAIGASAGGVKALQRLFSELPDDLGMAYVVIVHLSPDHPSQLSEILNERTSMQVLQVDDEPTLKPNCVYVIAPDRELVIKGDHVSSRPISEPRSRRAPIDMFFRSVAKGRGDGMAVVLSGAGSDGALGIQAIKEAGGVIFVQEPADADFPMMPRNAIATGVADFVGPVPHLAERIVEVARSKRALRLAEGDDAEREVRQIMGYLRTQTGHNFSGYKRNTVMRRITRRMQVARKTTLDSYGEFLRTNPEEVQELFSDLLISVTMFFRDAAAFESLAQKAIAQIFDRLRDDAPIRAWVVGCATGEEAYSVAILCLEEAARRSVYPAIQIFASDLDEGALATAREGRYSRAIAADVSEERLRRFFADDGEHYRVRKEVRDLVLFSSHSALKDPPFIRLDLITCRNLMIYLERELQRTLCDVFHYALNPGGFLFLGTAEAVDETELFAAIDRDARLYMAKPAYGRHLPALPPGQPHFLPAVTAGTARESGATAVALGRSHAAALEENAPPSILTDAGQKVLHLSPSAGRFIMPTEGVFSSELPQLARPELRVDLKLALQRAIEHGEPTLTLPIPVALDDGKRRIVVHAMPTGSEEKSGRRVLVYFLDGGPVRTSADDTAEGSANQSEEMRRLTEALTIVQERLTDSQREYDTATQELRAANEELQSINEEYRSTAEELETSKEELQSMNEELQTVNSELKIKLHAISSAHNDLQNLMSATEIGTLFLDETLRIKLLTPAVTTHFNITAADIGRNIADFTHRLVYDHVEQDAAEVLRTLVPSEKELATKSGRWLILRIRPYRTIENRIEGVVLTLVDITQRRNAERELRRSEERYRSLFNSMDEGFLAVQIVFDAERRPIDLACIDANPAAVTLLDAEIKGCRLGETVPQLAEAWSQIASGVGDTGNQPVRREAFAASMGRWFEFYVSPFVEDEAGPSATLLFQDVTARKNWEHSQRRLVGELNHRVKNMLALVQSIAYQTESSLGLAGAFSETFGQRLKALAEAHDLLTSSKWRGADLKDLIARCVRTLLSGDERLSTEGPPVHLSPNAVIVVAMALHELSTNAIKYGSLSAPDGTVEIHWTLDALADPPVLTLRWCERGGPDVTPPERSGFGTRMLQEALTMELDGHVQLDFPTTGLECTITFPVIEDQ